MSGSPNAADGLAALQRILDVYGGESRRWPAGCEQRFAALIASDNRARAMLAEARALDRVLSVEPAVVDRRGARLVDRILAAVEDGGAGQQMPGVAAAVPAPVVELAAARATRKAALRTRAPGTWRAAALLAASLLAGVFLGQLGGPTTMFGDVAALAGMAGDADTLTAALVQAEDGSIDEEAL
jgi:hypothetical protein